MILKGDNNLRVDKIHLIFLIEADSNISKKLLVNKRPIICILKLVMILDEGFGSLKDHIAYVVILCMRIFCYRLHKLWKLGRIVFKYTVQCFSIHGGPTNDYTTNYFYFFELEIDIWISPMMELSRNHPMGSTRIMEAEQDY